MELEKAEIRRREWPSASQTGLSVLGLARLNSTREADSGLDALATMGLHGWLR